jgi:membrane protein required for colicin V production
LLQPAAIESSQTLHLIEPWGPIVIDNFGRVIPVFKDMFTELGEFFNALSNKMQH